MAETEAYDYPGFLRKRRCGNMNINKNHYCSGSVSLTQSCKGDVFVEKNAYSAPYLPLLKMHRKHL